MWAVTESFIISYWDVAAFAWFIVCWLGFHYYADFSRKNVHSLVGVAHSRYKIWMDYMLAREERLIDARVLESLLVSVRFFASTSMLILAGLVTMLGYSEQGSTMLASLPFIQESSIIGWEGKTVLLIVIFIYSFFKCTWSIRQYSYAIVLIGSAPQKENSTPDYAENCAKLISNAASHFNMAIRGYYFSLSVLGWFIDPIVFLISTVWVILVLYRREFHSRALDILTKLH